MKYLSPPPPKIDYYDLTKMWYDSAMNSLFDEIIYWKAIEQFDSALLYSQKALQQNKSDFLASEQIKTIRSVSRKGKEYAEYLMGFKDPFEQYIVKSDTDSWDDGSDIFYLMGSISRDQQQYSKAIRYFNAYIWSDPTCESCAQMYSDLGYCQFVLGDYKAAKKSLDKAVKLKPGAAEAYYYLGKSNIILGYKEDGCDDLSKAGELGFLDAYEAMKKYCY